MFSESEKEWILEAINHLKRRKARPDFSRISLRMKRKHQFTSTQTRRLLDSLVESGFVVKAVYKNNTSYRDVSKWKKGRLGGQILNSSKMLKRFVKAIWANELRNKGTGVTVKQIEDWFSAENEDKCFLSGAALRDAIENEVSNGYLGKLVLDNEAFYSVNNEKLKELEDFIDDPVDLNLPVASAKKTGNLPHSDSDQDDATDSQSRMGENQQSSLMMAICETESGEGKGSSLIQITNWIIRNDCFASFQSNETVLLEALEAEVLRGCIQKLVDKDIVLYAVNENALDTDDTSDLSNLMNQSQSHTEDLPSAQPCSLSPKPHNSKSTGEKQINHTRNGSQKRPESEKISKTSAISLRPPSKRKRIMKDHGPDFETELPTKSRKITSTVPVSEPKESTYPTPVDSPVSEKSETTAEQNFKFDFKKKRGRPKKKSTQASESSKRSSPVMLDVDESSRQGPSEQSSICQDDDNSVDMPDTSYIEVQNWSAQQVANHFTEQGYKEIAEQMLENDMDGSALGLLRRSDIVGPPAGGMLKIRKLGVALKLFRDIRNLLYQGNAGNYSDPYEERSFMRS